MAILNEKEKKSLTTIDNKSEFDTNQMKILQTMFPACYVIYGEKVNSIDLCHFPEKKSFSTIKFLLRFFKLELERE
jgi:hypothetical protein